MQRGLGDKLGTAEASAYTLAFCAEVLEQDPLGCDRLYLLAHKPLRISKVNPGIKKGRPMIPMPCRRCGEMQPSVRAARTHCPPAKRVRKPRAMAKGASA